MARKRTAAYSKTYNTVSQPGVSLASGFFKGMNENFSAQRKMEQSLAPKIMEIQSRYGLEKMKQSTKQSQDETKQFSKEKSDLEKQLREIRKYYNNKKFTIKSKIAAAGEDDLGAIMGEGAASGEDSPKVKKYKNILSQLDQEQEQEESSILDQLKSYYIPKR